MLEVHICNPSTQGAKKEVNVKLVWATQQNNVSKLKDRSNWTTLLALYSAMEPIRTCFYGRLRKTVLGETNMS